MARVQHQTHSCAVAKNEVNQSIRRKDVVIEENDLGMNRMLQRMMEDEEFPYYAGVMNGMKCCTKCGATKTPQWREGPYGPKTLCNACGVKRTRKLRAEHEGGKRRKVGQKGIKPGNSKTHMHPALFPSDTVKKEESGLNCQGSATLTAKDLDLPSGLRRPTRRAAEEAAVRTAQYARTGEWANLNSPTFKTQQKQNRNSFKFDVQQNQQQTPTSSSEGGNSLPLSDCPEEIAWTPQMAKAFQSQSPDCVAKTPDDCFAAINLMTMSAKGSVSDTYFSPPRGTPQSSPSKAMASVAPSNSDVEAALKKAVQLTRDSVCSSEIETLSKSVPPGRVSELIHLSEELHSALEKVRNAEAELAAAAAIVASKQATLLESRSKAFGARDRVHQFVYELETECGLTHKVLPKIRVMPLQKSRTI